VHIVSHAILRSLQILRSPSALHDRHELAAALGGHPGAAVWSLLDLLPQALQRGLYRVALERGFEEMAVMRGVVGPVWRLLERLAAAERAWTAWLGEKRDGSTGSKQREVRR